MPLIILWCHVRVIPMPDHSIRCNLVLGVIDRRELEQEGVNATLIRQVGTERGHSKCQHNYNDRSICCFVRETIQLFVTSNMDTATQVKINRLPKGGGSVT